MRISIDLTNGTGSWGASDGGFGDGASIEDCGEIVLHLGPCDVRMNYLQFGRFLDNVLRWRWSINPETGDTGIDLGAETPPPSWEAHVEALQQEMTAERFSIASDLDHAADQQVTLPGPEKDDKAALRWFLAGRSRGRKEGLQAAAELVRERSKRLGLTPEPAPAKTPQTKSK